MSRVKLSELAVKRVCSHEYKSWWCSTVDADSYWSNGLWTAKYEQAINCTINTV